MFLEPFKTKGNTRIKSSERKKLRAKIASAFNLSEDGLNAVLPGKSSLHQLRLILHSKQTAVVYTCDYRPMFFEFCLGRDETKCVILPTVYALNISTNLVPTFTTQPDVISRLTSGANLMLPGSRTIQLNF